MKDPEGYQAMRDQEEISLLREISQGDPFAYQQALDDGYVLKRSYLRDGAQVRTLVFEKSRPRTPGFCACGWYIGHAGECTKK